MSCEQKFEQRVSLLRRRKEYLFGRPGYLVDLIATEARFLSQRPKFPEMMQRSLEDSFIEAAMLVTGGTRPEELDALIREVEQKWNEKICRLPPDQDEEEINYRLAINSLRVCQEVMRVSCVKTVPNL